MKFLKGIFKGVKDKIFNPIGRFVNRNKKALLTAAMIAGMVYTGGALAGTWTWGGSLVGSLAPGASLVTTASAGTGAGAALVGGQTLLGTGITTGLSEVASIGQDDDYGPIGRGPANRLISGRNRGYGYA